MGLGGLEDGGGWWRMVEGMVEGGNERDRAYYLHNAGNKKQRVCVRERESSGDGKCLVWVSLGERGLFRGLL